FSTRSRGLESTIAPSLTVTRSIASGLALASAEGAAGLAGALIARVRSRSNGAYTTGRSILSSVICGWPDHTLASVLQACTRPTVRRLLASRSPGCSSVTSLMFTFRDGHRPILVEPAIVSRYPVSRSTRAWIAEVRQPD